ncbi:MAG: DUF3368 domain-containing protein [Tunicatimonas sp.]|uniref:DUF3368 domain-containing protein n=1 Tax=Tunicatimonas sp. TaxID=1940096 RepID=UPI003C7758CA
MKIIVVSDTSPISNLIQVGRLQLLQSLFGHLIVPPYVDKEIQALSEFGYDLSSYEKAEWVKVRHPKYTDLVKELEEELDSGEAEAIAISKELEAGLLLIDERIGTQKANSLGLKTMGLLGCLLECKQRGILEQIKPIVEELEQRAGFFVGVKLKKLVYRLANEET